MKPKFDVGQNVCFYSQPLVVWKVIEVLEGRQNHFSYLVNKKTKDQVEINSLFPEYMLKPVEEIEKMTTYFDNMIESGKQKFEAQAAIAQTERERDAEIVRQKWAELIAAVRDKFREKTGMGIEYLPLVPGEDDVYSAPGYSTYVWFDLPEKFANVNIRVSNGTSLGIGPITVMHATSELSYFGDSRSIDWEPGNSFRLDQLDMALYQATLEKDHFEKLTAKLEKENQAKEAAKAPLTTSQKLLIALEEFIHENVENC